VIVTATNRLIIRHFHILDAEWLQQVFTDAEVMRFGPGVQTRQWIDDWLQRCLTQYHTWGFGPWAVVRKDSHETIGYCGLFYFPAVAGQPEVEVGYRLARACWGQGYASEAVVAARDYAFNVLSLPRLIAMIDP
jgi:RimJ/RimL family protein N-acetyltransferase